MLEGRIRVGPAEVDFGTSRVRRGRCVTRLEPKVMEVLACLLEARGELVSKDVLLDRVWADVHVTDAVVFRAVRLLREALGTDPALGPPIETLRGRGYRIAWPVLQAGAERPDLGGARPLSALATAATLLLATAALVWGGLYVSSVDGSARTDPGTTAPAERAVRAGLDSYVRLDRPGVESAILHFGRAVALDPQLARAHAGLAASLTQKHRLFDADPDLLVRARAAASRSVEIDPDLAEGHRALGLVAVETGRLTAARAAFERAVALDPDSTAQGNLGSVWLALGRPDLALAAYDRMPPGPLPPIWVRQVNRAAALAALERFEEARAALERARDDEPFHPGVLASVAGIEMLEGRLDDARRLLQVGLEVQPASPLLRTVDGELAILEGELDRAQSAFREALDVGGGSDPAARLGLAFVNLQLGAEAQARDALGEVEQQARHRLRTDDESIEPWVQLARVEALRDRPERAFAALRQAAEGGLPSPRAIERSPEFREVRRQPGFDPWMTELRARVRALDRAASATH